MEKLKDKFGYSYYNADLDFWKRLDWSTHTPNAISTCNIIHYNITHTLEVFAETVNLNLSGTLNLIPVASIAEDVKPIFRNTGIDLNEPFYIILTEDFHKQVSNWREQKFNTWIDKVFLYCKSLFAVQLVNKKYGVETYFEQKKEYAESMRNYVIGCIELPLGEPFLYDMINPNSNYSYDAVGRGACLFWDWVYRLKNIDEAKTQLPTQEEVEKIKDLFTDEMYGIEEELRRQVFSCSNSAPNMVEFYCFLIQDLKEYIKDYQQPQNLHKKPTLKSTNHLKQALDKYDFEKIIESIKTHFDGLPYDDSPSGNNSIKWEGFYRSNLFSYLKGFDIKADCEEHTRIGRSDLIIERENKIYCFEIKYDGDAKEAFDQIIQKGYLDKYKLEGKELIAFGLNFCKGEFKIEIYHQIV